MSKRIIFDDGAEATVYKRTDLRTKLTVDQTRTFMSAKKTLGIGDEVIVITRLAQ